MGLACFQAIFACHGGKPDTGKLYTHFLLVYMDVCGSTYGNGDWSMAVNLVLLTISKSVCNVLLSSTGQSCTECGKSSCNTFFFNCLQ